MVESGVRAYFAPIFSQLMANLGSWAEHALLVNSWKTNTDAPRAAGKSLASQQTEKKKRRFVTPLEHGARTLDVTQSPSSVPKLRLGSSISNLASRLVGARLCCAQYFSALGWPWPEHTSEQDPAPHSHSSAFAAGPSFDTIVPRLSPEEQSMTMP